MSEGLTLKVGEYGLPYPCDVRISKTSLKHPDSDAVIGYHERWDMTSYVLGATLGALKTAMDAVVEGVADGADVSLYQGETTVHLLDHSEAEGGVKFIQPLQYPAGAANAVWATNVPFTFAFEGDFYTGEGEDADLLWSTESYEYSNDEGGRARRVYSGELLVAAGATDDAYERAWDKSPGAIGGWIGPMARVRANKHDCAGGAAGGGSATKANYEFTYLRGPSDDYHEFSQTLEIDTQLTEFVIVPLLDANPIRQATVKGPGRARQFGRKVKAGSYPTAEDPEASWAGEANANLKAKTVTKELLQPVSGVGGTTNLYAVTWQYEFEAASDFSFP